MDVFMIACGEETSPAWLTPMCHKSSFAHKVVRQANDGARTLDDFESGGVRMTCTKRSKTDLYSIHLLRLSGYAVVTEPLIPDFGYKYTTNMEMWEKNKEVTKGPYGSMQLLHGLRVFTSSSAAKRHHAQLLERWNRNNEISPDSNACLAPPVIRYRADLWSKVRDHVSFFRKVYPYAMFWMEHAAKQSMLAEFDQKGRCRLIGRGAKREYDAMVETLRGAPDARS
jgi:hypothetical protein